MEVFFILGLPYEQEMNLLSDLVTRQERNEARFVTEAHFAGNGAFGKATKWQNYAVGTFSERHPP